MTRSVAQVEADLHACSERLEDVAGQARSLHARVGDRSMTPAERKLDAGYRAATERELELQAALRRERIGAEQAETEAARAHVLATFHAAGGFADTSGVVIHATQDTTPAAWSRQETPMLDAFSSRSAIESAALRGLERHPIPPRAGDRLDRLIRDRTADPAATGARYLAAVFDPAYESAFAKVLSYGQNASLAMTPQEAASMRAAMEAQAYREQATALGVGSGPTGGFAVPATLDPTVIPLSDGVLDPLRGIARVETVSTLEWRGLASDGVSVGYGQEGTAVPLAEPTFEQPSALTERVAATIRFSYEAGQDWPRVSRELAVMLAEAKDDLEASRFLYGLGHTFFEPDGLISTLDPTSIVPSTGWGTDEVYGLLEALPPRAAARARWLGSVASLNMVRRFVGGASEEPALMSDSGDQILRRPAHEHSGMAPEDKLLVGDFSKFVIIDRIGMSIELVPHLVNGDGALSGHRGLLALWRNTSTILDSGAFRLLQEGAGS